MMLLLFLTVIVVTLVAALRRELRRDGYGVRPPPVSRHDEIDPRFVG